jgi:DNA adenine methylase
MFIKQKEGIILSLNPILKWAGGKRQLLDQIKGLMPTQYNSYFEPFFGGGALLFELVPNKAVISDINKELILVYQTLQEDKSFYLLIKRLKEHEKNHSKEYFYEIRSMDQRAEFSTLPNWERAARIIYLNKACFNGLYRVNSKGFFNVPFNGKEKVKTFDETNIIGIKEYLSINEILILNADFEKTIIYAKKGDFVYFDPPYDPLTDKLSFTSYSENDFGKEDQKRLARIFKELAGKGVFVMLSNHNTPLIRGLYSEYNIHIVLAKRMINSDSSKRGDIEEVIITNY